MFYISISLTLLTILASLWYLGRVKSENSGMLQKVITWLVLLTALGVLICQIARGITMMRCSSAGCAKTEHCEMGGDGCHGKMMITKEIHKTKMGKGHCSHSKMAGSKCCGSGKCEGTGECKGKCESAMSCCGAGSDCCGSGKCQGTGACKGKCDEMKECCMNKKGTSGEDSVVIEKKVIIN
jgi:hypothetical protein